MTLFLLQLTLSDFGPLLPGQRSNQVDDWVT